MRNSPPRIVRLCLGIAVFTLVGLLCAAPVRAQLAMPAATVPENPPLLPMVITDGGQKLLLSQTDVTVTWNPSTRKLEVNRPGWWVINYPFEKIVGVSQGDTDAIALQVLGRPASEIKNWYVRTPGTSAVEPPSPTGPAPFVPHPHPTLVVDQNAAGASDANSGAPGSPLRTISEAVSRAQPGTVIRVYPGIYRETVSPSVGGTAAQPILLEGVRDGSGQMPVITGNDPAPPNAWTPVPGLANVWRAEHWTPVPAALARDGSLLRERTVVSELEEWEYSLNRGSPELAFPQLDGSVSPAPGQSALGSTWQVIQADGDQRIQLGSRGVFYLSTWFWYSPPSGDVFDEGAPVPITGNVNVPGGFRANRQSGSNFGSQLNPYRVWVNGNLMPASGQAGEPRANTDYSVSGDKWLRMQFQTGWNQIVVLLDSAQNTNRPNYFNFRFPAGSSAGPSQATTPTDFGSAGTGPSALHMREWLALGPIAPGSNERAIYLRVPAGVNPNQLNLDLGRRNHAVTQEHPYWTIRGFEMRHGAQYQQRALVELDREGNVFEYNLLRESENRAISAFAREFNNLADPMIVRGNWIVSPGALGIGGVGISPQLTNENQDTVAPGRGRVHIEYNTIIDNNRSGFDRFWESGAIKVFRYTNSVVRHNTIVDGDGPGIWYDWEHFKNRTEGNLIERVTGFGIGTEASPGPHLIANNVIRHITPGGAWFRSGILAWSSSRVWSVHNTIDSAHNLNYSEGGYRGGRWETQSQPLPDRNNVIANNLFLGNHETLHRSRIGVAEGNLLYGVQAFQERFPHGLQSNTNWSSGFDHVRFLASGQPRGGEARPVFRRPAVGDYRFAANELPTASGVHEAFTTTQGQTIDVVAPVAHDFFGLLRFPGEARSTGAFRVDPQPAPGETSQLEIELADGQLLRLWQPAADAPALPGEALAVDADTYINQTSPGSALGTQSTMVVRNTGTHRRVGVLRFNLEALGAPSAIESVSLRLFVDWRNTLHTASIRQALALAPDMDWTESGTGALNWENSPAVFRDNSLPLIGQWDILHPSAQAVPGQVKAGEWIEVDVTAAVLSRLADSRMQRIQFVLRGISSGFDDDVRYGTKEQADASRHPVLVVKRRATATPLSWESVQLAWAADPGAIGFEIERLGDDGVPWRAVGTATGNATGFRDTGLSADTVYFYRVRTVFPGRVSAWTAPLRVTTTSLNIIQPEADAFISAPEGGSGGGQVIWVKSLGDTTSGSRKGYFRFDLSGLDRPLDDASFELVVVTADNVPSSGNNFRLYALNPGASPGNGRLGEWWGENEIRWPNAPANNTNNGSSLLTGTGTANGGQSQLLMTRNLPGGTVVGDTLTFSGPELTAFLNANLGNRVTLVVTRAGGASATNTNFAAREHWTQPGPILRVLPRVPVSGYVEREYWTGIGTGTSVNNLTQHPRFPHEPNGRDRLHSLRAVSWNNSLVSSGWADAYGQRIRGYIVPPATGTYSFWISSDDNSELWLSTNSEPAGATRIARVTSWTSTLEWNKFPEQRSAPVNLVAGQPYYFEVLHKEGAGGDNLAVGWLRPGQNGNTPSEIIPGSVLSAFSLGVPTSGAISDSTPPVFQTQPQSQTVYVGQVAAFSSLAEGNPAPVYQWQRHVGGTWSNIAGATGSILTLSTGDTSAAGQYRVIASNAAGQTVSPAATLSVIQDSGLPGLSAVGIGSGTVFVSRVLGNGDWELATDASGIDANGPGIDSLIFDYSEAEGDFQAVVNIRGLSGPAGARAGLLVREGDGIHVRTALIAARPDTRYTHQARSTLGAAASAPAVAADANGEIQHSFPDKWLMLERNGDVITVAVSNDDDTYTPVGTYVLANLQSTLQIGLFAASGTPTATAVATFRDFSVLLRNAPEVRYDFESSATPWADTGAAPALDGTAVGTVSRHTADSATGTASLRVVGNGYDYLRTPNHPLLDGTNALTIAFWARPLATSINDGAARGMLSKRTAANSNVAYSIFMWTGGRFFVDLDGGSSTPHRTDSGHVMLPAWQHIAVVFDGSLPQAQRVRIYINGMLVRTASHPSTQIRARASDLFIGSLNANYQSAGGPASFDGWMDDIRIYRRSLDSDGIAAVMRASGHLPVE